jgi:hypothetical protein
MDTLNFPGLGQFPGVGPVVNAVEKVLPDDEGLNEDV